jgi:hypothetical protein
MESKFNIDGTSSQLVQQICILQKDINDIRECNKEIQTLNHSDSTAGFWIALLFMFVFFGGFISGRASKND